MPTLEQGVIETVELIADLLQRGMNLAPGVVQIYNQKRDLPSTTGLQIDVAIVGQKQFGVNSRPNPLFADPVANAMESIQTVNQQELIQIDIFSYDASARLRKLDVIFSLTGNLAQQSQEKYAYKIGNIPQSFVDASEVQASGRLNRYALTFALLRAYEYRQPIPSFAEFRIPPIVHTDPPLPRTNPPN